jgi:hypothetical protein
MHKRPIIRPKIAPSPDAPPIVRPRTWHFSVPDPVLTRKEPAPIWTPTIEHKPRVVVEPPFPQHVHDVIQKFCPHRPPLKAMVDAMRLDGFSEERIKKTRDFYATMRRTVDKRQAELEKIFGRYTKPVKKVLKVLKKV